ncbi:MAG: HAD-IIIC family phosphatase [Acidobacteriaceae bacterium]
MYADLDWLPERPDWPELLAQARSAPPAEALPLLRALASSRIDFTRTLKLDRAAQAKLHHPEGLTPVRLAVLGSSTLTHLLPAIRVAGLRRGLWIEVYEAPFGTYRQELADPVSSLHSFRPTAVLLALDADHAVDLEHAGGPGHALTTMRECWRLATNSLSCAVLQQTLLPIFPAVLGNNEHRLSHSPAAIVERTNNCLREASTAAGVQLLALDTFARTAGLARWHDPALWHRAKQEVHPAVAPLYGEQVARLLAALLGQTAKCLVLDLDHTLWGGGIGDDGLEGIVLGQGSAAGEAHLELQRYALALRDRGIVLAVCSKNDEANALLPFERHPEMLLRRADIACFVANWDDKAANLRRIARELNLGLDALVFVDDNPVERGLIRRELPEVHVPEMPEDPAGYVPVLAAAGYFEGLGVTDEDRQRAASYAALSAARSAGNRPEAATDLNSYLESLHMELLWSPFDATSRARITQLINKTNQFNLTTRRTVEPEIAQLTTRPEVLTLQLRLRDIYGDHGMIAVVTAEPPPEPLGAPFMPQPHRGMGGENEPQPTPEPTDLLITDWLMSCRVLGRKVERATLNLLVEQARTRGARRLIGRYLPTAKNAMVRDLYPGLGFTLLQQGPGEATLWSLDLASYQPAAVPIDCNPPESADQRPVP